MQEGSFRCDANVSVRRPGAPLGIRCEIKNLNSFRFMQEAIDFEVHRQIALIEDGGTVVQETRLYDPDRRETRSMRSKEDAQDYRYFPDPDLPPLVIDEDWVRLIQESLPELPPAMKARLIRDHGLSEYDAAQLTMDRDVVDYYEQSVKSWQPGDTRAHKLIANWILGEVSAALNRAELDIKQSPVQPAQLVGLLKRIADSTISGKIAKDVFDAMWAGEARGENAADAIIAKRGLTPDFRRRCHRENRRRRHRRESGNRRRIQGWQGEGVQFARRQGDGGIEGQGQPGAGQQHPEEEARCVTKLLGVKPNFRTAAERRACPDQGALIADQRKAGARAARC